MTTTTASSGVTYDPATTATSLATSYTSGQQTLLTAQTKSATASATALSSLQSALSSFQSSLSGLGSQKSLVSQSASFDNPAIGSAVASSGAADGSYAFFVDSLATASQVSFGVGDTSADGGDLVVKQDNVPAFTVSLGSADLDGDGVLTPKELAAAINAEPENKSRVTASVVTVGAQAQLILTSAATGLAGKLTLDASGVTNTTLVSALTAPTDLVQARDAIVWLGAPGTGTKLTQGSNTFNVIDHVKITFTKAMGSGDAPVKLNIGTDQAATRAKVQAFVDNFNTFKGVVDGMTYSGNPGKKLPAGAFASDAGVNVLRNRLIEAVQGKLSGVSENLTTYGITMGRDGTLSLNTSKLTSALDSNPSGLDKVIGNANTANSVAGKLDKILGAWSNATSGQLNQRKAGVEKLQASLEARQTKLDSQYDSAYKRYLAQYTKLQSLQSQMASNSSLFSSMLSGN